MNRAWSICREEVEFCFDPLVGKDSNDVYNCRSAYYEGYRNLLRRRLGIHTNLYQLSAQTT